MMWPCTRSRCGASQFVSFGSFQTDQRETRGSPAKLPE
jgi:hypothetical protein